MIYDAKPWLKSYDDGVEPEIPIPEASLTDFFSKVCREFGDRPALHFIGSTMTFGELDEHAGRFAAGLRAMGLGKGDVVAIGLPNLPQYHVTVVGALRAGCAISGVAPLLTPREMAFQLQATGAKVLVTLDALVGGQFAPVAAETPSIQRVLVTGAADLLPGTGDDPVLPSIPGTTVASYRSFLAAHPDPPETVEISPNDPCFIQFTGGTTGVPKGAVLTHRNIVANIAQFSHWSGFVPGEKSWLTAFPMFHLAGLWASCHALVLGHHQAVIADPRNLEVIVDAFDRYRPETVCNVPSLTFIHAHRRCGTNG